MVSVFPFSTLCLFPFPSACVSLLLSCLFVCLYFLFFFFLYRVSVGFYISYQFVSLGVLSFCLWFKTGNIDLSCRSSFKVKFRKS